MPTPDLFPTAPDPAANLLPRDGVLHDYGICFSAVDADRYLQQLLTQIPWQHDRLLIYGKPVTTAREIAWYGDRPFNYRYSGSDHRARPWDDTLRALKTAVERISGSHYNACLLNLYHDGNEGMGWHSDDEAVLGDNPDIASLSFGATRKFAFRHKAGGEKVALFLQHGQLIVMRGATQTHWQHALLKSKKIHATRVNLTFRSIVDAP